MKYHRLRQNLSSHCAAAIIIARRALDFKESPPSEVQTGQPVKFHYKWQNVALKFVSSRKRNTDLKPDVLFWRDLFKLVSAQKARMLRGTLRGSKSSRLLKCGNVSLMSLAVWGCHDQV